MSDLLNDSPTAVKIRDQILSELQPGEKILYVTEAHVTEPDGSNEVKYWNFWNGALIVTTTRLLIAESKAFGRAYIHGPSWREVEKSGRYDDGEVGIVKEGRRPIWKIQIWEGKEYKTPLDKTRLDMLSMAIREARDAVEAEMALENAMHDADVSNEYEELKRRRGF